MEKPQGFLKKDKVRKKSDFLTLRQNSQKFVTRHCIAYYKKNEQGFPRLAISVSTVFGNAVVRNHFRRCCREQFRLKKAKLPPFDIHFVAKRKKMLLSRAEFSRELHEDLERFLHRLS